MDREHKTNCDCERCEISRDFFEGIKEYEYESVN